MGVVKEKRVKIAIVVISVKVSTDNQNNTFKKDTTKMTHQYKSFRHGREG